MPSQIKLLSSMATRQLLADLVAHYQQSVNQPVATESVGGVDAARRVEAGEAVDVVVLASGAIDKLLASGRLVAGSRVDLVNSGVAVAVQAGAQRPDIHDEAAVRSAVLAARSLSVSTGPSGVQLAKLFERWGIADVLKDRIVQAPPGVPVGTLVARGEVALGFQQFSELMGLPGIDLLGPLPPEIQINTTFSAALATSSTQPDAVRALLQAMASPAVAEIKRRNGMEPA